MTPRLTPQPYGRTINQQVPDRRCYLSQITGRYHCELCLDDAWYDRATQTYRRRKISKTSTTTRKCPVLLH